ncbi:hypothetical protein CKO28_04745 [Rhodovibrio sodomensis]|uniref:Nudix hydrolase domain-containing protein n=1 Tax=Rhodovibrio sodomensis TaxID=1088 RepID=A0ABS1DA75_9PROT|nr:NUDIX domain-containing protein [Rhodovibrio sodomensis]MBK1667336.1 hypothetical protein [Rhodovibrio sodomensis]
MLYVAGFAFSPDARKVALIRKSKPAWQAGLLNAIGGKVEPGEREIDAMVREFAEETGAMTRPADWSPVVMLKGSEFEVAFFRSFAVELSALRSMESERVEVHAVLPVPPDTIPNLHWLIPLSLDNLYLPVDLHDVGGTEEGRPTHLATAVSASGRVTSLTPPSRLSW